MSKLRRRKVDQPWIFGSSEFFEVLGFGVVVVVVVCRKELLEPPFRGSAALSLRVSSLGFRFKALFTGFSAALKNASLCNLQIIPEGLCLTHTHTQHA